MGIISGSGSFRGRFGDHFRVGDHFGVDHFGVGQSPFLGAVKNPGNEAGSASLASLPNEREWAP